MKTTFIQVQIAICWRTFSSNGNYRLSDSKEIATDKKTRWLVSLIGAFYEITVEDMTTKKLHQKSKILFGYGEKKEKERKRDLEVKNIRPERYAKLAMNI